MAQEFEYKGTDDVMQQAKRAIEEWAAPNLELAWVGSEEVMLHAEEIANYLWEQGLLRRDNAPEAQPDIGP